MDTLKSLQESLSILDTARRRAYRTQHQLSTHKASQAPSGQGRCADDTAPVSRKELEELLSLSEDENNGLDELVAFQASVYSSGK